MVHLVLLPLWAQLNTPGKMSNFQKFSGVRPKRVNIPPERQQNSLAVDMEIRVS